MPFIALYRDSALANVRYYQMLSVMTFIQAEMIFGNFYSSSVAGSSMTASNKSISRESLSAKPTNIGWLDFVGVTPASEFGTDRK